MAPLVELAFRTSDQIEVSLLWDRAKDDVFVRVVDSGTEEAFMLRTPRDRALDVFRHPFAYTQRRTSGVLVE